MPSLEIQIYTTRVCPYCVRAKKLFQKKGVEYTEIDVSDDEPMREFMINRSGGKRTVPQIFINGQHVGGCDDLYDLEADGKLDPMLAGRA
jgi:glutaredoxin 3